MLDNIVIQRPLLTVIIKSFNEEKRIEAAIKSVLCATEKICFEIILADSLSTDQTVELALKYPIKIIQLLDPTHRSCGIGPEIGYRFASGEYILLMDGDMELVPSFIEVSLDMLERDPDLAGVGGQIEECCITNLLFQNRVKANLAHLLAGPVDRLTGGGIFRRSSLTRSGYFTNRNLHAFEEFELGLRLLEFGYRLERIPIVAFRHYGHEISTFQLLQMRVRSRYANAPGELLRIAWDKPWFWRVAREFRVFIGTLCWWLALTVSLLLLPWSWWPLLTVFHFGVFVTAFMILRKRNWRLGLYAPIAWSIFALSSVIGFFKNPVPECDPIPTRMLGMTGCIRVG